MTESALGGGQNYRCCAVALCRSALTVEQHPGQKHIVVIRGRCECIRNVSLRCYANFYFLGAQNVKL